MSENSQPCDSQACHSQACNKKPLIFMSILGLIVMAVIAFVVTRPAKVALITDLYQYYPESTAFYLELSPGEKLSSRFFQSVDNLRTMSGGTPGHGQIKVADIFQKDFEPYFSVGTLTAAGAAPASKEPPFLMVLPMKNGVSAETLAQDLKVSMDSFNVIKEGDATLYESKTQQHPPIAIAHKHLLLASNMETLKQALAEYKTPETLLDNPLYKDNLKLLPAARQGTLLTLTGEFNNLSQSKSQDPTVRKFVEFKQQMQAVTPVLLGSIVIERDQFIKFDSFSPVDMAKVKDAAFRQDIAAVFAKQATFDLAATLPQDTVLYGGMVGLGNYYDIYMKHMANAQGKEATNGIETQLKMVGLDLRKNIISLLDGKSAISVVAKPGQPDVLLFLNHTPDTQKTMEQVGTMAAQAMGGKMVAQTVDASHVVNVLDAPKLPVKVAYSNVQNDMLVLGTQSGMEKMYDVQQKKAPSLKESTLYKELAAGFPEKATGVFYVNTTQGAEMLDALAKASHKGSPAKTQSMKEVLGGIEGIAGTNTLDGGKMMRGHLTIKLAADK